MYTLQPIAPHLSCLLSKSDYYSCGCVTDDDDAIVVDLNAAKYWTNNIIRRAAQGYLVARAVIAEVAEFKESKEYWSDLAYHPIRDENIPQSK